MTDNLLSIVKIIEEKYNLDVPDGNTLPGEECLYEKLSIEKDETINKDKIKSMRYLYELGNPINKEELDYVESKIIKFITSDPYEISECFNLYNITQEVCNPRGLSGDLMDILASMITLKRNNNLENSFKNYMITVENRLGKYIPDIIKNILDISETYENNYCNGVISENTILMKKLYSTIIKKNSSHKNYKFPDLNIMKYFESFQDNILTRIIFLGFLAYILGKIIGTFNVSYKINGN